MQIENRSDLPEYIQNNYAQFLEVTRDPDINPDAFTLFQVLLKRDKAYKKAVDSLSRYKFEMFGYWSAAWVKYNQLLSRGHKQNNPFKEFVDLAKTKREDQS